MEETRTRTPLPLVIVFYSYTGNNRLLATELSRRLNNCPAFEVLPCKNRAKISILFDLFFRRQPKIAQIVLPPEGVKQLLFIGPLWDSTVAHPLQSAIRQLRPKVETYSLVTLCGGERPSQPAKIRSKLQESAGDEPRHVWELHVADLLAPHDGAASMKSCKTQVSPDDLTTYESQITEIVATLQAEMQ